MLRNQCAIEIMKLFGDISSKALTDTGGGHNGPVF
jgi:hypothetical protein